MNEIKIRNWSTILSEANHLYLVSLTHRNSLLSFIVEDEINNTFIVEIKHPGPYRIYDEQYLQDYWGLRDNDINWTFIVEGSNWENLYPELLEVYDPNSKHYVIATLDICLEVLSTEEPSVRAI